MKITITADRQAVLEVLLLLYHDTHHVYPSEAVGRLAVSEWASTRGIARFIVLQAKKTRNARLTMPIYVAKYIFKNQYFSQHLQNQSFVDAFYAALHLTLTNANAL